MPSKLLSLRYQADSNPSHSASSSNLSYLASTERWTTPRESLSGALPGWFERQKPGSILQLQEDLAVVGFFFLRRPKLGRKTGRPRLPVLLAVESRQLFGEFLSKPHRDVNVNEWRESLAMLRTLHSASDLHLDREAEGRVLILGKTDAIHREDALCFQRFLGAANSG